MPESEPENKLSTDLLVRAYSQGIFPMSIDGEIAWFSPDPRCIINLDKFHASQRLLRTYRHGGFELRVNTAFEEVMRACAVREDDRPGSGIWISEEIVEAYCMLFRQGLAHSVEAYFDSQLVGGLYGVALGGAFMGESMFHRQTDASKVCMVFLVERLKQRGFTLLDCQYQTEHLERFGSELISQDEYLSRLKAALQGNCQFN